MKGVGRNDPCPCGSGRKYKKCCMGKLPRDRCVYVGHREPFDGVTFGGGQVVVHLPSGERAKADAVFSQTQYTKKSGGDKVLSRIPNKAVVHVPAYLSSEFDVIWVIDTNTKQINDSLVSISCVLECYARRVAATQIEMACRKHGYIPFRNCPDGESERYGWFRLVMMITSNPNYSANVRIAVVSDHDLARHPKYNTGELPIYRDFCLPSNFRLLYAASDGGEANVLNRLIIKCDKEANKILRQLSQKGSFTIGNSTVAIGRIPSLGSA